MCEAMTRRSRLTVEHLENIGPHYAPTLRAWRLNFEARLDDVRRLGFDDTFIRMWRYYLAYCEAAFATRTLNDLHLVLTRPNNRSR
jgi:cyclopropane-fatty-acyl-phospholipid synthase